MNIAVEGCSHGKLDLIYAAVEHAQLTSGMTIDLLICCGDFQSVRNPGDLRCMAAPVKYLNMESFYKYYNGEKKAPVLTLFIGGNHEASNYLQELPYGGWVAPNIYYLGYGGVVNVGGLRIGGVSGIYKGVDYLKGKYERPPYTESSIRSVYHVRNLEVFRMKQLDQSGAPLDIFFSHDWPRGVTQFGDAERLCRQKPFFKEEVESDALGSKPAQELLHHLQPRYWFSGHLHVKFVALVDHSLDSDNKKGDEENNPKHSPRFTRFLALDKCLPRREFLQVLNIKCSQRHKYQNVKLDSSCDPEEKIDVSISRRTGIEGLPHVTSPLESNLYSYSPFDETGEIQLHHDLEWLTILRLTDHLMKVGSNSVYMPGPGHSERYNFVPTEDDLLETLRLMNGDLRIHPSQFCRTVEGFDPERDAHLIEHIDTVQQPEPVVNPYTQELCERLGIRDPMAELLKGVPGRSPFGGRTPKGTGLLSEADVTLNASRLSCPDDSRANDSDILFEVSITDLTDGTSEGVLSPVVTSSRSAARKLQLSSPVVVSTRSPESCAATESTSTVGSTSAATTDSTSAATTDSISTTTTDFTATATTDSPSVSTENSTSTATTHSPSTAAKNSTSAATENSTSTADSTSVAGLSHTSGTCDTTATSPRPKRPSLCLSSPRKTVPDDVPACVRPSVCDVADVQGDVEKLQLKPSKIRRRNAALYVTSDE